MIWRSGVVISAVLLLSAFAKSDDSPTDLSEEAGKKYLEKWNEELSKLTTESVQASWNYESNITDYNLEKMLEASARLARFNKEEWKNYPWMTYKDPDTRRQFQKYSFLGSAALPTEKYERLEKVVKEMEGIYGKAKICEYRNASKCDLYLEPEISERYAKSRDPEELKYLWTEWRNATGKSVRKLFTEYVALSNEAAKLNNYSDASAVWLKDYESDDFTDQVEALWQQVRPLYVQLHAYVRRRLRELYGEDVVSKTGPIPAHLLGNMWAQTWNNILNDTVPYPNKPSIDVTAEMIEQKYTPLKMFQVAEEFFTSIGLSPMPDTFWKNSIIEKPNDGRDLICHASAWDFYDGKDFRIKQCTRVNSEDLETVHHEMGHVQYFLQYKDLPIAYKEGANPGFHEAVGDVMALSVSTPKHFQKIGLLTNAVDDQESEINQLFGMALSKIAFLPFGYLMDQWRWGVFQGKITEKNYNCKWWELREQYQGMQPPSQRSEEDFDPGAKYHIVANVPYIRYFVSFIIQFQFHRSLCIAAGEFDPQNPELKPLHKCDIYQNKNAGELLGKMLQMGSSKPWPDAMDVLTGQRNMDAGALLQYFSTLQTWLERENARTGEYIGWEPTSSSWEEDERVHYYELEEPDDSSEDGNFECSYAELVPQNGNSFESTVYREKFEPRMNHKLRRTINQYKKHKKSPVTLDHTRLKLKRKAFWHRPGVGEDVSTNEPVLHFQPLDKDHMYDKRLQSPFSKLLYSLGTSLPRPRIISDEGKHLVPAVHKVNSSDIIWKAEMMRIKAEEMLKSYDIKDNMNAEKSVVDGNGPNTIPSSRHCVQFPSGKGLPLWCPAKEPESNPPEKKTAKKSFMHYHYNVRTPVFYNTIVLKKPPSNIWIDDMSTIKIHPDHIPEQELADGKLLGYSDRWRAIKLVPVDRNRMIQLRQYSSDFTGENARKRRLGGRNRRRTHSMIGRIRSDSLNNVSPKCFSDECCSRRR